MIPQRTMRLFVFASANNWIRDLQLAGIPPPQSAALGLLDVARILLQFLYYVTYLFISAEALT